MHLETGQIPQPVFEQAVEGLVNLGWLREIAGGLGWLSARRVKRESYKRSADEAELVALGETVIG